MYFSLLCCLILGDNLAELEDNFENQLKSKVYIGLL